MSEAVENLKQRVVGALEDMKAVDLTVLDVRGKSSVTDYMVVVSGTSSRHVKAMADNVVMETKKAGTPPLGVEGDQQGDWVLVDLGDVIAHIMMPETRAFYQLEKFWSDLGSDENRSSQAG